MTRPFPYLQIADELRDQIATGGLAEGERLPSENALAARYETTRTTVRKALALLRSEGHLVSEQGRGVFVRPRPEVHLVGDGISVRREAKDRHHELQRGSCCSGARSSSGDPERGSAPSRCGDGRSPEGERRNPPCGPAPALRGRRASNATGRRLLPGLACRGDRAREGGPNPRWFARRARGSRVGEAADSVHGGVELRMPTPVEAESLMVPSGVPVARVIRTAYDFNEEPVEVLVSVVPGDRHRFVYEIALPE